MRLFLCRAGSACCQAGWWSNGLAEFIVASLMPAVNPAISGAAISLAEVARGVYLSRVIS
jgi:hypothetical protein